MNTLLEWLQTFSYTNREISLSADVVENYSFAVIRGSSNIGIFVGLLATGSYVAIVVEVSLRTIARLPI